MLKLRKTENGVVATVSNRDGDVLVTKSVANEVEGLSYLSALAASVDEGYRYEGVVKEGF